MDKIDKKTQILFFTSGSSGFPLGAFKRKENLIEEVLVLKDLLEEYCIKRVVVTVPFVHIYGVLVGLLLPLYINDVALVVKDDFLPHELLNEASCSDTLIVTTPVFIKALTKLNENIFLRSSLFISSTGPLAKEDVSTFEEKYQTKLMQLFGSTETGGIGYKIGDSDIWKTLPKVYVSAKEDKLMVHSPFISSYILDQEILEIDDNIITEDIIELHDNAFKLIGRSNKIIKIAGKRISAIQIESILETIEEIDKAIVELVYSKNLLRSEQIKIILQSSQTISKNTIKDKISEYYGVLTIPFVIEYVDKISLSSMGKKIIF